MLNPQSYLQCCFTCGFGALQPARARLAASRCASEAAIGCACRLPYGHRNSCKAFKGKTGISSIATAFATCKASEKKLPLLFLGEGWGEVKFHFLKVADPELVSEVSDGDDLHLRIIPLLG